MSDAREALRETSLRIWAGDVDLTSDDVLDDICRIVADALTSDAAVEAATRDAFALDRVLYPGDTWDTFDNEDREIYRNSVRVNLRSALAAAGITNGGAS